MPQINSSVERTVCAKCGNILLHGPPGARPYPDFCSNCERQILNSLSKRERGRRFLKEKLKK